jgi:HK97 gp10 family phage protein
VANPAEAEATAARTLFVWNVHELEELLRGPAGPVVRDLVKRAYRVEAAAKMIASHPPPSVPGSGPAVRTGRLRNSITWRVGADFLGAYADVGSAVFYAPFVELGTSRMQARPFLRPALNAARVS